MSKTTAITKAPSQAILASLREDFEVEQGYAAQLPPRLGMYSQDVTEEVKNKKTGKKEINVISEAGTFYTEKRSEDTDEDGKAIFVKEELGTSVEAVILFERKQLRYYNESTEEYTSSPIYDSKDEEIPLFLNKKEVARGLPADLKAKPEFQEVKNGKKRSALEDNRILYVLFNEEVYQLNLRGTSMYAYNDYKKSTVPPAVLTEFSSETMEKGDITWNKMTFTVKRDLSETEIVESIQPQRDEIKQAIAAQKEYFANKNGGENSEEQEKANKGFKAM